MHKRTYMVFLKGEHIANQMAGTVRNACQLVAYKKELNVHFLTAASLANNTDAEIEAARKASKDLV